MIFPRPDGTMWISIHAPRGGSDVGGVYYPPKIMFISIHAPRGGSDTATAGFDEINVLFQSTLPAGGATLPEVFGGT